MLDLRILSAVTLVALFAISPAIAQTGGSSTQQQQTKADQKSEAEKKAEAAKKAEEEKKKAEQAKKAEEAKKKAEQAKKEKEKNVAKSYLGTFSTSNLAGGTTNELLVPVPPEKLNVLLDDMSEKVKINWPNWHSDKATNLCPGQVGSPKPSEKIGIRAKKKVKNDDKMSTLVVDVPPAPCWWPLTQAAHITIKAEVINDAGQWTEQTLFDQTVYITVYWFPLAVTLLVLALIYPGCAMAAFYLHQRRYEIDCKEAKANGKLPPPEPDFFKTLDPVQITANAHGRGNLAKLQIFAFSLIVFGLLLYYQLRYGVLAGMSPDVMKLMGISAVGAVGGKITYDYKRRLTLENWAWLRRKDWLPPEAEQQSAKWSDLFLDSDTKEFDVYSFQMAVFSLVLAVALMRSGLSGLASFKISDELLALLGLSQVVFISGKASEKSGYKELDTKLTEVRKHEGKYIELKNDPKEDERKKADAELKAFHDSALQAAEMFWSVYIEQLKSRPRATQKDKVLAMVPAAE